MEFLGRQSINAVRITYDIYYSDLRENIQLCIRDFSINHSSPLPPPPGQNGIQNCQEPINEFARIYGECSGA
jgi:hypothetical protein